MRFLADENIEAPIVARLRGAGYDVLSVAEAHSGFADPPVLSLAVTHGRVLIINDKDFAELTFRRRQASAGIILLRLHGLLGDQKATILLEVLAQLGRRVEEAFTVVGEAYTRSRPLPSRT